MNMRARDQPVIVRVCTATDAPAQITPQRAYYPVGIIEKHDGSYRGHKVPSIEIVCRALVIFTRRISIQ
jgi:hypothetical protein